MKISLTPSKDLVIMKMIINDGLVEFAIKLYYKQVPKNDLLLVEARWYLFGKYQDSDRLPLTAVAFKYKILRTQLIC